MQSWHFQITAAAAFSVTIARSEVITFMQPLAVTKKRLFIQNPKQTFNFLAYTQTITNTAWIVIAVTVVVTPFFLYITVRRWAFNIHLLTTISIISFESFLNLVSKKKKKTSKNSLGENQLYFLWVLSLWGDGVTLQKNSLQELPFSRKIYSTLLVYY